MRTYGQKNSHSGCFFLLTRLEPSASRSIQWLKWCLQNEKNKSFDLLSFWLVLTEKMPVLFYDFYAINVDTVVFNLAILNDELLFTFEMTNKVF